MLSSFGSSATRGTGVHTGSGTQFYYPAQAAQGPDGTIYTRRSSAHHRGHQPAGLPRGQHDPRAGRQRRRHPGHGRRQLLSGRLHLLLPGRAAVQRRRRQHLHHPPGHPHRLPRRRPCADRLPRLGGRTDLVGHGQLLRPGHHSIGVRLLRPLVARRLLPPPAVVLGGEHRLARRRDHPLPHHRPAPLHHRRAGRHPPHHPGRRPAARALPGAGLALRHGLLTAEAPRDHLPALYRRGRRRPARPRQPPERHRCRGAGRSPRGGPQRPARTRRAARGHRRLEHLPPQLLALEPDARERAARRP